VTFAHVLRGHYARRLYADGYRTSTYSCPKRRNTKECDNPSVNDLIIGEFVMNYILNMLNAKSGFSKIRNPEALEKRLLFGSTFAEVEHVEENGLNEFYNLLSRYGSDDSYTFSIRKPRKKRAAVDPEIEKLRREKEKHERALKRLQNLFLYSDSPISEKEFIIKKSEISKNLEDVNSMLGMVSRGADSVLSDEEFVKQASHLLISKELSDRQYIYFKKLAQSVSPEILKTYMETILDSVMVMDGRISSIVFRNGLTHKFIYKA
jgi:site-specific DNA recombinase